MKKIAIVGATSAIAQATARIFAKRGDALFLIARDEEKLKTVVEDLRVRGGGPVGYMIADANDIDRHQEQFDKAVATLGGLDTVLIAHGVLGNQADDEKDYQRIKDVVQTNFLSVTSMVTILAGLFEKQGSGTIAVISSVAGDRGRKSNYVYGTSKAAVSTFLQGVRGRLVQSGVKVITIKPGFVDTPMTADLPKGALFASADKVGRGIVKAIDKGKEVVYLPSIWWPIMFIVRHVPERIFKKLNF